MHTVKSGSPGWRLAIFCAQGQRTAPQTLAHCFLCSSPSCLHWAVSDTFQVCVGVRPLVGEGVLLCPAGAHTSQHPRRPFPTFLLAHLASCPELRCVRRLHHLRSGAVVTAWGFGFLTCEMGVATCSGLCVARCLTSVSAILVIVIVHVCSLPQSPKGFKHLLRAGPGLGSAETVVGQ